MLFQHIILTALNTKETMDFIISQFMKLYKRKVTAWQMLYCR